MYLDGLADLDARDVLAAAHASVRESRFFPTVAELRERAWDAAETRRFAERAASVPRLVEPEPRCVHGKTACAPCERESRDRVTAMLKRTVAVLRGTA